MIQLSAGLVAACASDDGEAEAPGAGEIPVETKLFPQSVASGDPRPESVVLWTRVDAAEQGAEVEVYLQVSKSRKFNALVELDGEPHQVLAAASENDFCVRVRIVDLKPDTTYYYRFVCRHGAEFVSSRLGRTRTAPEPDSDEPVRFAVMSCQDYGGRYYHVHRYASDADIHFFVHLGDYIYETTGDPEFQNGDDARRVEFSDTDGALPLKRGDEAFFAARSLGNYRELYRIVRSDPDLQRLHERHPMIAVWDDHEFSNDAWGQHSTYDDGKASELDPERRANADQAWFEYMPVDYLDPDFEFDSEGEYPDNFRIYRDFRFGQHLHLVLTDLRRYRGDHLIDEGAFPGAMAVTEKQLKSVTDELPELAVPYVDIDEYNDGEYKEFFLAQESDGLVFDFPVEAFSGELSVPFINELLSAADAEPPDEIDGSEAGLKRGIAYHSLGKSEMFTSRGSRYFVNADAFEWISKVRYLESGGDSEVVMGAPQEKWFIKALKDSTQTWKVWGNEFTLMRRHINLTNPVFPAAIRGNLQISAEDWDGMPNRRAELLRALDKVENLTVVTGDVHSFFVGDVGIPEGESVFEFVSGAVSSATFQAILGGIQPDQVAGLEGFVGIAGPLIQENSPHMAYQDLANNGFATFEAGSSELLATLHTIDFEKISEPKLDGDLEDHFDAVKFRIRSKSAALERDFDGEYRVWDREAQEFA